MGKTGQKRNQEDKSDLFTSDNSSDFDFDDFDDDENQKLYQENQKLFSKNQKLQSVCKRLRLENEELNHTNESLNNAMNIISDLIKDLELHEPLKTPTPTPTLPEKSVSFIPSSSYVFEGEYPKTLNELNKPTLNMLSKEIGNAWRDVASCIGIDSVDITSSVYAGAPATVCTAYMMERASNMCVSMENLAKALDWAKHKCLIHNNYGFSDDIVKIYHPK